MSERRKWDKPSDIHTISSSSDVTATGNASAPSADPVLEKQRQYIRMLEERNRLRKKLVAASKVQKAREQLLEREEAFVTTFNTPKPSATAAHHHHHHLSSGGATVRKNKSAAVLLPTRMAAASSAAKATAAGDSDRANSCRSAPTTTLRTHRGDTSERDGAEQPHRASGSRAKWSKPQGPMTLAVETRDGRAHVCLADPLASDAKRIDASDPAPRKNDGDDEKDGDEGDSDHSDDREVAGGDIDIDDDDDVDASYLEESFEEFDESDDRSGDAAIADAKDTRRDAPVSQLKAIAPATSPPDLMLARRETKSLDAQQPQQRASDSLASPPELSRTTTELFAVIQHLSRAKQKALTDVLLKFETSARRERDVQELQSSIGDPQIWQQLTATLFNDSTAATPAVVSTASSRDTDHSHASAATTDNVEPTPLAQVLQEQRQWEEAYAQQVKLRLVKEREDKERALREAEARRVAMMQQLEDEERELERLVEQKRQERLAKLRALEMEIDSDDVAAPGGGTTAAASIASKPSVRSVRKPDRGVNSAAADEDNGAREAKRHGKNASPTKRSPKKRSDKDRQSKATLLLEDELLRVALDTKSPAGVPTATNSERESKSAPVVPPLKFGLVAVPALLERHAVATPSSSAVELRIKLFSTWGKTRAVGLTQISAYDTNGDELAVDLASLKLFEQSETQPVPNTHEMVRELGRLFNGVAYTNSEQDMWLGRLPSSGTLQLCFEVPSAPSKLCVWNYNSKLAAACTRDIEVLVSGKCVWTGSLPETFGDEDDNVCTWINVRPPSKKASARTARQSVTASTARSLAAADSKTLSPAQAQTARVEPSSSASSTPLWLSDSLFAPPLTSRVASSASEAKLDLFAAEEKAPSGGISARRRPLADVDSEGEEQGDSKASAKISARSQRSGYSDNTRDRADAEHRSSRYDEPELLRNSVNVASAPTRSSSTTSMWDSLEHFSKTNRSRLPQATGDDVGSEALDKSGSITADTDAKNVSEWKPTASKTSSALLSDLKSMSSSLYGCAPAAVSELKSGSSTASIVATLLPTPRADSSDMRDAPVIPELPSGTRLRLDLLSTWDDPHYIGLNGIEVFDHTGALVAFRHPERQIRACPASINVLDEYSDDPRVATNLVDGINFTSDDFHMWLAPFTPGDEHFVELTFDTPISISMVRVWNYNKSRAHSFRGVRHARLRIYESSSTSKTTPAASRPYSASTVIFEGEIAKALGLVSADSIDQACEVILFTRDAELLRAIEANDRTLLQFAQSNDEEAESRSLVASVRSSMEMQRPRTSDRGRLAGDGGGSARQHESYSDYMRHGNNDESLRVGSDGRPATAAAARPYAVRKSIDSWTVTLDGEPQQRSPVLEKVAEMCDDTDADEDGDDWLMRGRRITIKLLSTWGDANYIGLTQLDVLVGKCGTPLALDASQIDATPRDLESLGYHGDPRTLDKLIDGTGTTCDDTHMWLVPLSTSQEIRIDLKSEQLIYGLRVWNYNKSGEDSFRGVKQLHVSVDGLVVSPKGCGFVLRKAPGVALFDFHQVIRFDAAAAVSGSTEGASYAEKLWYPFHLRTYKTPIVRQDYEPSLFPQGFLLKFIFWTTWGDPYYLGLNGLEIYDFYNKRLALAPQVVAAKPYSITEINGASGGAPDVRVPENLFNGRNKNTWDASDAWLAPLASSLGNCDGNVVYVAFDAPVVISMIKFWNYSKSPERGVKDFDIYLDDRHLYSGTLRRAPSGSGSSHGLGRLGTKVQVTEEFSQPILFSTNQAQVDMEKRKVLYCGTEEQDVLCINEGQVMQESKAMYRKPDPGAEGVVVDLGLRPTTALCRH